MDSNDIMRLYYSIYFQIFDDNDILSVNIPDNVFSLRKGVLLNYSHFS